MDHTVRKMIEAWGKPKAKKFNQTEFENLKALVNGHELDSQQRFLAQEELQKLINNKKEMYSNMQYYMEYCEINGYVTPMQWIEKHKHF